MTSPPDKIFREGLGQYQKKAPPSAWDRIEHNLNHKKNHFPWIKIAAGLMLVVATSILLWKQNQSARSEQLAVSSEESEQLAVSSEQLTATNRESSVLSREEKVEVEASHRNESKKVDDAVNTNPQSIVSSLSSPVSNVPAANTRDKEDMKISDPNEIMTEPSPIAQVETTNQMPTDEVVAAHKGTNITYTADQVNSKFLKKEIPVEATSEKKNTSGIQKVINVAMVLKYDEPIVGELREKKNEWLSINTSPKKREINK